MVAVVYQDSQEMAWNAQVLEKEKIEKKKKEGI